MVLFDRSFRTLPIWQNCCLQYCSSVSCLKYNNQANARWSERTIELQNYKTGIRWQHYESFDCFEYLQNIPSQIRPLPKILAKISYPRKPRKRKFQAPKKSFDRHRNLKSEVPPWENWCTDSINWARPEAAQLMSIRSNENRQNFFHIEILYVPSF